MARPQNRSRRTGGRRRHRKKISFLTREKIEYVDYKDINLLRKFISDRAKIRARRVTGNNERQQQAVALAIKNAREMALLPYENRVTTQRRVSENSRFGADRTDEELDRRTPTQAASGRPSESPQVRSGRPPESPQARSGRPPESPQARSGRPSESPQADPSEVSGAASPGVAASQSQPSTRPTQENSPAATAEGPAMAEPPTDGEATAAEESAAADTDSQEGRQ